MPRFKRGPVNSGAGKSEVERSLETTFESLAQNPELQWSTQDHASSMKKAAPRRRHCRLATGVFASRAMLSPQSKIKRANSTPGSWISEEYQPVFKSMLPNWHEGEFLHPQSKTSNSHRHRPKTHISPRFFHLASQQGMKE